MRAGVHRQHQHLAAEALGDLPDQLGAGDGRGVHADLVRAGPQQPVDVVGAAHAAADRQRDEDLLGGAAHHVVGGLPVAGGRGDVQEGQLVGALGVVELGHLDRVARVAQVLEVDALDDPAGVDVQAGDDTDREGHAGVPPAGARYASTSTSTRTRESTNPATTTIVAAGPHVAEQLLVGAADVVGVPGVA